MKKLRTGIMAAALLAPLISSCSYKNVDYSTRTVSVHGTGSVSIDADNATLVLSVITRGPNVATAANENAVKMAAVRSSVLRAGIAKDCVTTENFSVFQESHFEGGKQIMDDYRITNQIQILVKDVGIVSNIIDTALSSGANQLSSLQYGISDTSIALKQARTIAVQQAQEAAQLIAGTSGAKLGKVLRIDEQQDFANRRSVSLVANAMMADGITVEEASTPVQAGKSTLTVSVDAIYELK